MDNLRLGKIWKGVKRQPRSGNPFASVQHTIILFFLRFRKRHFSIDHHTLHHFRTAKGCTHTSPLRLSAKYLLDIVVFAFFFSHPPSRTLHHTHHHTRTKAAPHHRCWVVGHCCSLSVDDGAKVPHAWNDLLTLTAARRVLAPSHRILLCMCVLC